MAYFKKYNGYYVKDAEAIKHVSLNGNTVTTKDADGNTVDQFNLPGGGFPSATYMSYLNPAFIEAYQNNIRSSIFSRLAVSDGRNLGLVASEEIVGYADITFNNFYTLGDLHVQTIHSWKTFSKDGNAQYNSNLGYENNYRRQIRPNRYRALIHVGKYGNSITINSDTTTKVMAMNRESVSVKDPSGKTIGIATVVGVKPYLDPEYNNTGVDLYLTGNSIIAYHLSTTNRMITSFVVEVEIMLHDIDVENFDAAPQTGIPFIESANGYQYVESSASPYNCYAETRVVVKNRGNVSGYYIDEYTLTYDATNDAWSWERTSSREIPDNLTSGTFYNTTFAFTHNTYDGRTHKTQDNLSAVAYMVGLGEGSQSAVSRSDAIPIASLNNWPSS